MATGQKKSSTGSIKKRSPQALDELENQVEGVAEYRATEENIIRERYQARDLRRSKWWQRQLAAGRCHHCGGEFLPNQLTMDHLLPLSRGGRSQKGNVAPSCAGCNIQKKNKLPWHDPSQNDA